MKRFSFDENDENENEDELDDKEFFSMAQFPIESENDLINSAIKICESNIFWRFLSVDRKLSNIEKTYYFLQSIIDQESEGE